jgi:hypothetical protein
VQPVLIDIAKAELPELRTECKRLGLKAGPKATITQCRSRLRLYASNYKLYLRWIELANLLFTPNHTIRTDTLDSLVDGVCDRLYTRLALHGYITKPGKGLKLLRDTANNRHFAILSRQNKRVLNIHIYNSDGTEAKSPMGACALVYAVQLAFPDIDAIVTQWEQPKTEQEK